VPEPGPEILSELHDARRVELLEDAAVAKIGQNLKYDLLVLRRAGVPLRGIGFDTMIASYLLDPGRREHGLDSLALQHLDHRTITYEEVTGKGKARSPSPRSSWTGCRDYACEDADIALRLAAALRAGARAAAPRAALRDVEMPLVEVLAEMEWNGIRIDEPSSEPRSRLAASCARWRGDLRGGGDGVQHRLQPAAPGDPLRAAEAAGHQADQDGPSTDGACWSSSPRRATRLPTLLMQYRQLDKLQSTYVEALPRMVNPETGRLHTSFNQTVASTGRLSSSDPNLQNIPIRTELGAEIRRGFVPGRGARLRLGRLLADRAAHPRALLGGPGLRGGVPRGRTSTARPPRWSSASSPPVTREMRDRAKTVNFAVIYGIGPSRWRSSSG
jgi:DNA polymerase I